MFITCHELLTLFVKFPLPGSHFETKVCDGLFMLLALNHSSIEKAFALVTVASDVEWFTLMLSPLPFNANPPPLKSLPEPLFNGREVIPWLALPESSAAVVPDVSSKCSSKTLPLMFAQCPVAALFGKLVPSAVALSVKYPPLLLNGVKFPCSVVFVSNFTAESPVESVIVQLMNAHLLVTVVFKSAEAPQLIAAAVLSIIKVRLPSLTLCEVLSYART